jgi:alpha-N-acetylglucosaminidase
MLTACALALIVQLHVAAAPDPAAATSALAGRVLGERGAEFRFEQIPTDDGKDVFEFESSGGTATVRGSSGVAMATGLNWYLRYHCNANISWGGDQIHLPKPLPDAPKTRQASPYKHRYNFNYCTFSYTMAFWDWERWQREIDWMALNGINMPLSVTGQEAVWQKVYADLGLSKEAIQQFFVGPAYLPFGWMGCMDGWGGPLSQDWIDRHCRLEKQIVARERELGMTPVLQGFTGHVPPSIKERFPEAKLQQLPKWCGFTGTTVLDPTDPLFITIGKAFVEEQSRQYGTDHYYASDTFIEMSPPSNDPAFLSGMGKSIYASMSAADPEAVWVMQGWIFFNNPTFWKPAQSKALLGAVPDDRMLLLDLFCDKSPVWKLTESFYGKPWAWCIVHNFGGTPAMFGKLDTIAQGMPGALADPQRGKLSGMGMMMEGIENNPVVYELTAEMGWRTEAPDLGEWIGDYARRRYGQTDTNTEAAWQGLLKTVYQSSGSPKSVICARPDLKDLSMRTGTRGMYDTITLMEACEKLLAAADRFGAEDTYQYDLVNAVRQVLSNLAEPLQAECARAYKTRDAQALKEASSTYLDLIRDMDTLLATRREFLLGRWIGAAKRWAANPEEARHYEWNARNQITLWGPRESELHEYAHKHWSGLITSFYLPRWTQFLQQLETSLSENKPLNTKQWQDDIMDWEAAWTHETDSFPDAPAGNAVDVARALLEKYGPRVRQDFAATTESPTLQSLSTGKPATCSSSLPPYPANLANDGIVGDTDQYWATDTNLDPNPWWQVDLEQPQTVGRVVVIAYYGDERQYGFTVETSLDGKNWEMVADRRDNMLPSTSKGYACRFTPKTCRYLRINETSSSANTGRHLVEVAAFSE